MLRLQERYHETPKPTQRQLEHRQQSSRYSSPHNATQFAGVSEPLTGAHRARAGPRCGFNNTLTVTPLRSNHLPIFPRSPTRQPRRGSPLSSACHRLPAGRAPAASAASFRDAFLPTEPLPSPAANRHPPSLSTPRRAPAPSSPRARPQAPFIRPSGHSRGGPAPPPTLYLSGAVLIVAPAEGGGGKPADTGSQHGTDRADRRPSPLRDLPAAHPAPSGSGKRNRKRGGGERDTPLPLRGMMGVVVSRRHVVPSCGLRLDALCASEAGASRRSVPPAAILSAARRSLGPGAGGAVPSGAAGQAVDQFRREKRKRQQLRQ